MLSPALRTIDRVVTSTSQDRSCCHQHQHFARSIVLSPALRTIDRAVTSISHDRSCCHQNFALSIVLSPALAHGCSENKTIEREIEIRRKKLFVWVVSRLVGDRPMSSQFRKSTVHLCCKLPTDFHNISII